MSKRSIIITGCLGFIGSHFTKRCLDSNWDVTGIDKITYAANLECLDEFSAKGSFHFIQEDIRDLKELPSGDLLVNFAAETHVDNSINDSRNFIFDEHKWS
jgi:dTDP-glucose 4,6-dehydratase